MGALQAMFSMRKSNTIDVVSLHMLSFLSFFTRSKLNLLNVERRGAFCLAFEGSVETASVDGGGLLLGRASA